MNSDNGARLSFFFHQLAEELVTELNAHTALIRRLEEKIEELSQAGVKGYNATDLGNMVSEIERAGLLADYIDQRITEHPEMTGEDIARDIARGEAEEVLRNTSFSVTVD